MDDAQIAFNDTSEPSHKTPQEWTIELLTAILKINLQMQLMLTEMRKANAQR